jgi:hypothetical protein
VGGPVGGDRLGGGGLGEGVGPWFAIAAVISEPVEIVSQLEIVSLDTDVGSY